MVETQELPAAAPSPADEERLKRLCVRQVGRLRVTTELHANSLRTEFYPKLVIREEWAGVILIRLRKASYPLAQLLSGWPGGKHNRFWQESVQHWQTFDIEIDSAMKAVVGAEDNPSIRSAQAHVTLACHHLRIWQESVPYIGTPADAEDAFLQVDHHEVSRDLDEFIDEFREAIESGGELDICRKSRVLCLAGYDAQVGSPHTWHARRTGVIALHERALSLLRADTEYYGNTETRLSMLQTWTPEVYDSMAAGRPV
jgi:hypothetical protein